MNLIKKVIHKFIHLWDEYDKASKFFAPPKLNFYLGKWGNYGGLPVWRRGVVIRIGKYGQYHDESGENWKGLLANHQVWNKEFLAGCSRFGRWWRRFIKPVYQLPDWCSFYYCNRDIMYKSKYDSWRYEFPGQFCIVIFNICFAVYTTAPITRIDVIKHTNISSNITYPSDDAYWEAMLEYNYGDKSVCDEERLRYAISEICCFGKTNTEMQLKIDEARQKMNKYRNTPEYEKYWDQLQKLYHKQIDIAYIYARPEYLNSCGQKIWTEVNEALKHEKKNLKYYWID